MKLAIGGDGLAREYINSPELNAQKFVRNPFSADPHARLYRTGDQARYLADGTVEFLGRMDDQVKINGFRMHLAEVERSLQSLAGVRQAAVVARGDEAGSKQLVAYVVLESNVSTADMRNALKQRVPAYMIPSQFVSMPALPLTSNGKLDRRALPQPDRQPDPVHDLTPAATPLQQRVLSVWQEIFGRTDIGIDDNFFDLGGHSLLATRVLARLNQGCNANLSLSTLFAAPTIRTLSEKLAVGGPAPGPGPILRRPSVRRT